MILDTQSAQISQKQDEIGWLYVYIYIYIYIYIYKCIYIYKYIYMYIYILKMSAFVNFTVEKELITSQGCKKLRLLMAFLKKDMHI